ncbi:mannose-6-phosphate isomerase, class I [Flexivirga caeni]|uniref:mannose-6-phosphate isomerase n=1 Tax=Flexivirga caeni TaxID=2294115 RepID=A0A3M9ME02_9MICO|nr:mannose-6-phosphate isomerase, class I [Flexivirga caeni]RNI23800.1 mannose-6-phosphate isomerase, class I [Flexivirga caeni]
MIGEDEARRTAVAGRLRPQIKHYAWGSHTALAELTGRPAPTREPEAELWMGAHEAAPSGIGDVTLDVLVATDPVGTLGPQVAAHFGGRFPFLLKVLAPQTALSIQVHPDAAQALEAPSGTYVDGWPKPESLVAISRFEIFAGLRTYDDICRVARLLGLRALSGLAEVAAGATDPVAATLAAILLAGPDLRRTLVEEARAACGVQFVGPDAGAFDAIRRVSEQFPGDVGIAVLPLMVHRVLDPGDYIFVPPDVLHAYVHGTCVELLANSDNIVRAGLTPKQLNVEELLRIVVSGREMIPERPTPGRVHSFPVDVPHFQLHVIEPGIDPVMLPGADRPRIALALRGSVTVACAGKGIALAPGESAFLGASAGDASAAGDGTLYLATSGIANH